MTNAFPFLSTYDPPGTSEGTLDPLGLYQIADQLAVHLVPAVRERMQRIRFLTAMAVGSILTEDLEENPRHRDSSPFLAWEWLIVEAISRTMEDDPSVRGVPGTQVASRAIGQSGYLDARSYLKTPRVFGFHGVYKRLAVHLDLVDIHLGQGRNAEALVDAWAKGLGLGGLRGAGPLLSRWRDGIRRSIEANPPKTRANWNLERWTELADAFAPASSTAPERTYLKRLLLKGDRDHLGALPLIWKAHSEFEDKTFSEEALHPRLEELDPSLVPLIQAIRAYELFCRSLQDAFDLLRAEAGWSDSRGYHIPDIAKDVEFEQCTHLLHERYWRVHEALGEINVRNLPLQNSFDERFGSFSEPLDAAGAALQLCAHHELIQAGKSADGKRSWFDALGQNRIHIRVQYQATRPEIRPQRYVHDYRGWPIRRFRGDLT